MLKKNQPRSPLVTEFSDDDEDDDLVETEDEDRPQAQMLAETFDFSCCTSMQSPNKEMSCTVISRTESISNVRGLGKQVTVPCPSTTRTL